MHLFYVDIPSTARLCVFTSRKLGAAKAEMAESEETPVVICSDFSNAQMHHILQSKSNTHDSIQCEVYVYIYIHTYR